MAWCVSRRLRSIPEASFVKGMGTCLSDVQILLLKELLRHLQRLERLLGVSDVACNKRGKGEK